MKIDSKKLASFITKVCANGAIVDCVLKFEQDGLRITVKEHASAGGTENSGCACTGLLRNHAFTDYTPNMVAAVKDVSVLLNTLKDMTGDVDLKLDGNEFVLTTNGPIAQIAALIMPKEQFVGCNLDKMPSPPFDDGFVVDATALMLAKKKFDQFKVPFVIMTTKDGMLSLRAGEDNFDRVTILTSVAYKDATSKFGEVMMDIIGVLEGNISIAFDTEYPASITEQNEDYVIKWLVAPMTVQE